tara:strand:+ start:1287 stop:1886 length:600 start_codon:yes stop_codon:yes gene_type:complete
MPRVFVTLNDATKVVLYDSEDTFDVFKQKCTSKFPASSANLRVCLNLPCLNLPFFPQVESVAELEEGDTLLLKDDGPFPAEAASTEAGDEPDEEATFVHFLSSTPFPVSVRRMGQYSEQLTVLVDRTCVFEWRFQPTYSFKCPLNCGECVPVAATTDDRLLSKWVDKAWTNHRGRYHHPTKPPPSSHCSMSKLMAKLPM